MEMELMITGASGYLGSRLYYDLSKGSKTIGTYHTRQLSEEFMKMDVTSEREVFDAVKEFRPSHIIHCAAKVGAGPCDSDPMGAIACNEKGTRNLANAANHFGSSLIYVSTIGTHEGDNFYTKTKLSGESEAKKTRAGCLILRPSFLLGVSPNTNDDIFFNKILNDIATKKASEYDNSWLFQPTWIGHLSEIIRKSIDEGKRNGELDVIVPDMKSKFQIAKDMLELFGLDPKESKRNSNRNSILYKGNLEQAGMPVYDYAQIKERILKEIMQKGSYVL